MASTTQPTEPEAAPEPLLTLSAPFPSSIRIFLRTWGMKIICHLFFRHMAWRSPLPRDQWPTYTKNYGVVPGLTREARIFVPKSWKAGDKPLPTLINIHGGGFVVGHPVVNDRLNADLAYKHGFLVIAIGYRLSPQQKFPGHTHDVLAQMKAVLADESLPIDHSKVALVGDSAGANLCWSACQIDNFHTNFRAVVGLWPSVDWSTSSEVKMEARVDNGEEDVVYPLSKAFYYGYTRPGIDRRDPLLSPLYADREKIPKKTFIVGCEHDMLCREGRMMAEKMAEGEKGEERVVTADGNGWTQGGVKWELVRGVRHGFNSMAEIEKDKEKQRTIFERCSKLYAEVAAWLHEEVFV